MPENDDSLFGNLPSYQAMPTSSNIEDRRGDPIDYAARMRNVFPAPLNDPTRNVGQIANPNLHSLYHYGLGDYSASFNRYFSPQFMGALAQRPSPALSDALPYIGSHEPIAPGEQGWAPPQYGGYLDLSMMARGGAQ
jgi:hypothetical protein